MNFIKNNAFGILALFISACAMGHSWCQGVKNEEMNYYNKAFNNQPKLKITEAPIIETLRFPGTFMDPYHDPRMKKATIDTVIAFERLGVTGSLQIENIGSSLAKIITIVSMDTLYRGDYIRKHFMSEDFRANRYLGKPVEDSFQDEILPGEKVSLRFDQTIKFMHDGSFMLHYLIFYENESENLYDRFLFLYFF